MKKAPLTPDLLKPQLAELSETVPQGPEWIYESKYDGYRILGQKKNKKISLISRNGKDWTHRFPEVARALAKIECDSCVIDGEIVVVGKTGQSSFSSLQKTLSGEARLPFQYFVFDLLYADGFDLRPLPLIARKRILEHLIEGHNGKADSTLQYSAHSAVDGKKLFAQACRMQAEGIIAKSATAPYTGRRGSNWLKIKCRLEDEFVIGGYTDPAGSRAHFGSLLVGYFDRGKFHYAGKVGTGFDQKLLYEIKEQLRSKESKEKSFATELSSLERRNAHFVRPELVAQIGYTEWTADGRLRHPVFLGLREDKAAREVKRPAPAKLLTKN